MNQTMMDEQLRLESDAKQEAISRLRSDHERLVKQDSAADTAKAKPLIREIVAPLITVVSDALVAAKAGKPGTNVAAARLIKDMAPEMLSFLAVRAALNKLLGTPPKTRVSQICSAIGKDIEDELKFGEFHKQKPALWHTVLRSVKGNTTTHKKTVLRLAANRYDVYWRPWTVDECMKVGGWVSQYLVATGLIELWTSYESNKIHQHFRLTEQAGLYLEKADEWLCRIAVFNEPTVVEPKPWKGLSGGGYYSTERPALRLIKGRLNDDQRQALTDADLSQVYDAVNSLQATRWRVNRRVLDVLVWAFDGHHEIGDLPPTDDVPMPPRPADIDTNEPARREWRRSAALIHKERASRKSKRLQAALAIAAANKFKGYEPIFMPYQVDFRGRMYAVPCGLNPQGPGHVRALLEFADGKPIDNIEHAQWLMVHVANCYGVDKAPFHERVQWCQDNEDLIKSVAADPMGDTRWADADDPFMFLAAAIDYAGLLDHGYGYVSHLPVSMDGSCNGLQHYSALLRDPVGGGATNLIPADKPQDIYMRVANVAVDILANRPESVAKEDGDLALAAKWVEFGITRSMAKRPVMVLPYGGTKRAFNTYLRDSFDERVRNGEADPFGEDLNRAVCLLTDACWEAVGEVVVAARQGMDWLRQAASKAARDGHAVKWTVPSGFVAYQEYQELDFRLIDTLPRTASIRLRVHVGEDSGRINRRRQANGLPPNFIHSYDAAHLVLSVNAAVPEGITDFLMVHDSYGTHAADIGRLSGILREQFVRMYEENEPLDEMAAQLEALGVEDLDPTPSKGSLNLDGVESSPYFFA